MMIELPVEAVASQRFTVQLAVDKYVFYIRWNDRAECFTLDLSEEVTGTILIEGAALVLGTDILEPYNFHIGSLLMIDGNGTGKDADLTTLGTRVKLYWFSEDEVNGIINATV